ncbi:hypothetical protein ON010_g5178 [Phytophthora cinnamomi]|nr:hypothetical protein ON010_g5178 [Phytophthora cinnamomi]
MSDHYEQNLVRVRRVPSRWVNCIYRLGYLARAAALLALKWSAVMSLAHAEEDMCLKTPSSEANSCTAFFSSGAASSARSVSTMSLPSALYSFSDGYLGSRLVQEYLNLIVRQRARVVTVRAAITQHLLLRHAARTASPSHRLVRRHTQDLDVAAHGDQCRVLVLARGQDLRAVPVVGVRAAAHEVVVRRPEPAPRVDEQHGRLEVDAAPGLDVAAHERVPLVHHLLGGRREAEAGHVHERQVGQAAPLAAHAQEVQLLRASRRLGRAHERLLAG